MAANAQQTPNDADNNQQTNQKSADKEYNFDKVRKALERETMEKEQQKQENARLKEELEKTKKLASQAFNQPEEDDDDDEPYITRKRLNKNLSKLEQKVKDEVDSAADAKAKKLFEDFQKTQWLENNPDFYEIMDHADAFAEKAPHVAKTILKMPEGFDRHKLVYETIKAMGLHKKEEPKTGIQDKIDANRRTYNYQPSGQGAPPYGTVTTGKDYSESDQKNAYLKMKEMQKRIRLGG